MNLKLNYKTYFFLKTLIWIVYGIYAIYAIFTLNSFDLKASVLLSGILTELTLISFIRNWYRKRQPLLLDWFRLATYFSIVLNFLIIAFDLDQNIEILVHNAVMVNSAQALPSLLVILCGLLSLKASEFLLLFSSLKNKVKTTHKNGLKYQLVFRLREVFYVLTVFVGIIQIWLVLKGITGYGDYDINESVFTSFFVQTVKILGPTLLGICAVMFFKFRFRVRMFLIFFVAYFILQLLLGFLSGMKEAIIIPIIIVLVPYLLGGNKVPKKLVFIISVFVVLLYPINNNYRYILNNSTKLNKVESFKLAILKTLENDFIDNFFKGTESYQERVSLFPIFMYSVENEENWTEYKYLNRYIYLPVAWIIPRFILPDKPVGNTGKRLSYKTTGNNFSSITPSTFGWSYFEGGYIPTAISFIIFGIFIAYCQLKLNRNSPLGLLIYTLILINMIKVESDIFFRISGLLQTIFVSYLMYKSFFTIKIKKVVEISPIT